CVYVRLLDAPSCDQDVRTEGRPAVDRPCLGRDVGSIDRPMRPGRPPPWIGGRRRPLVTDPHFQLSSHIAYQNGAALPSRVLLLNAYSLLPRASWTPCVIAWDAETGEFRRVEGPEGLTTWEEADEASRFLARILPTPNQRAVSNATLEAPRR